MAVFTHRSATMEDHVEHPSKTAIDDAHQEEDASGTNQQDLVWGAPAIGAEINRTASQVHYLHAIGALRGVVHKVSHKMLVGSRRKLREWPLG
jgi:hypothetical protein